MNRTFTLLDALAIRDLQTYLSRAARIEEGSVRLISGGGVLAVYVAVVYPFGLLDEVPTVLGLRTFGLRDTEAFDVVVPVASLLERVKRAVELSDGADDDEQGVTVTVPMEVNTVTWAAISPPRGGWHDQGTIPTKVLDTTARAGIDEVAEAVPTGTGQQLVHRVRSEVWGRPIDDFEYIPGGGGFAALSLGFLGDDLSEQARVFETGPWTRITTARGHVLIKRRAWTLAR